MKTIDKLPDNLPKEKESIEKAFEDCIRDERKIIRTRTYLYCLCQI